MRKILGIAIFLLTLLPMIDTEGAYTIHAQNLAYENGSFWLPDVEVDGQRKVRCDCCKEAFDDEEAFSRHLKYSYACQIYYGPDDGDDKDDVIEGKCCFCGKPIEQCTCTGVVVPGHSGGSSGGSPGGTTIVTGGGNSGSSETDTEIWFDDVVDTVATSPKRTYTSEQELEFAKQLSETIRCLIEELEKDGKIIFSDKDANCHYDPNTGSIILPANSDFTSGAVVHELIHYIQDKLGILDINICGSDNEYQAYVINYIFMTTMGEVNYTIPQGLTGNNSWENFQKAVEIHCKRINGVVTYDSSFIKALNELKHEDLSRSFRGYWETTDEYNNSTNNSVYYKAHDDNYNWKWEQILKSLGFKEIK